MATKAKLTLSQFLFRRSNSNLTNNSNGNGSSNNNNNDSCKSEQCSSVNPSSKGQGQMNNHHHGHSRKVSVGSCSISANGVGKRHGVHEVITPPRPKSSQSHHKHSSQQQPQLQSILKKPSRNAEIDVGFGAGKPTRSSLHRSRSNPNPSNNPLKEVSWSCPTLEKRREVILNYFERIILENKQEQNVTKGMRQKPNIPCENVSASGVSPTGEPIYEEISDCSAGNFPNNNTHTEKMGSLKPKLGPKKVRMNIPQQQQQQQRLQQNQGYERDSPIYDKLLCRSQSMIEPLSGSSASSSTSSYSGSGYYDVAPSITTSISSSSSSTNQSLYENCRPYTASESDYAGFSRDDSLPAPKTLTRMAGRSHSFHDNYRSGSSNIYNFQVNPKAQHLETDQIYAKVCKRKKMKVSSNNNDQSTKTTTAHHHHHQHHYQVAQQQQQHLPPHQRQQSSSSSLSSNSSTFSSDDNTLSVQVSCGNVVTMIPVIMPCSSSFSTSCLSLSSSSDNNTEDTIIATTTTSTSCSSSATTAAIRNNEHDNDSNGYIHYDAEKILPDKEIAYASKSCELQDNNNNNNSHYHHQHHRHHQRAFITASASSAAGNRNNLSVIHLLAAYDPHQKEIEEFIPATPTFTAIIDSTECAPKSISVPVRVVDFTSSGSGSGTSSSTHLNNTSTVLLTKDEQEEEEEVCYQYLPAPSSIPASTHSQRPLMVTNCSFSYDAEEEEDEDDDEYDDFEDEEDEDIKEGGKMYSSASSTSGSSDEDHQEMKYSFADGRLVNRIKSISFQDDAITKELLLLTTSDSEDDELCEHKSLLEMTSTNESADLLDDGGIEKGEKYLALMDDEDRGFDSFMDENDGSGDPKNDHAFRSENLKNQRTFAQEQQNVPEETLKKKAASVLDLINSEISDLHMRELELKKLHSPPPPHSTEKSEKEIMNDGDNTGEEFEEGSSGEDDFSDSAIEYDGFTTNGSHSSGQVSPSENLNEMGNHQQEEQEQEQVEAKPEENEETINEEKIEEPLVSTEKRPRSPGDIKVRPLEEEEDKTIKFNVMDETPIEREIRLTREREEEFRRLNNLSSSNTSSTRSNDRNSPSQAQKPKLGSLPVKSTTVSHRPEHETPSLPASGMSKDLQYEMATARFKKEIEESMKREKELVLEGLLKKGVANETVSSVPAEETSSQAPAQEEDPKIENIESEDKTTPTPVTPPPKEQQQQPQAPQPKPAPESVLRKPTIAKVPNKLPAARFFSPPAYNGNKPNRITPVVSPIIAKGSFPFPSPNGNTTTPVGGSLPIGISRPSFTSMEKYMMQSSMMKTKTIGASQTSIDEEPVKQVLPEPVQLAKPQPPIHEDPLRIVLQKTKSIDEESGNEEKEEEEKPKRRYIPAQDKIQKEIQELVMREKELNRTRAKWKSTLDLPESMKDPEEPNLSQTTQSTLSLHASVDAEESEDANNKGANNDSNNVEDLDSKKAAEDARQVTRVKAPARRRNSWLINQWEERIRQQQQTTNKK